MRVPGAPEVPLQGSESSSHFSHIPRALAGDLVEQLSCLNQW